ncbi:MULTISPECIES: MFS transporter [Fischerella]|uniref:MFS transporter n=1 Tax=Fischerella muscicola CCMEE 5323 TaxID=2019572 RepID=A0A2N6K3V5_FISMU|nr:MULTISPECIES: MFS transporter [Fischerella]MBD2429987.1 MFS transporter [Fischerella sp. FACHB-380]PLZ90410.1 MFS transporter [Fischerella muscicola CCMEE 5323]
MSSKLRSLLRNPAWIGVALSFYAFIAIGIAEGGLGVLIPSIQATFNLNSATITLLFLSQVSGYVFAALTSSLMSSRFGLARMLLLASFCLTCALVTYAVSPYWLLMVAAGTFVGLGIGLIDAGINTYIANHQGNADLMGLLHAFYGVGALLGPAVATTLLAMNVNWRGVYLVIATIVGLTVLGMLWAVVYNYRPLNKRTSVTDTSATASLSVALRTPTVLLAGLLLLVYVGTEASVGNWAYSVQTVSRGTPEILAGYSVSAYWLGLTLGRLATGRVVRYLGAVRTLDSALMLLGIGLTAWWLLPKQLLSLPIIGFALAPIFPMTIWLMPQRIPAAIVPAGIGFMTSVASLGAAGIPAGVGAVADRFGLGIIPVLMIPLVVIMVILHRWLVERSPTNQS